LLEDRISAAEGGLSPPPFVPRLLLFENFTPVPIYANQPFLVAVKMHNLPSFVTSKNVMFKK